jgi:hypothetical protein
VFPHFPHTISKAAVTAGSLFGRGISPKRLWCAAFLAQSVPALRFVFVW